jgi:hypothetical protein
MNKNYLDEMQIQKKDKIGNRAFMILVYLLMLDIGLYGLGFRWLEYPMNIMVITLACMAYHLISLVVSGSYVGPKTAKKVVKKRISITVGIAVITAVLVNLIINKNFSQLSQTKDFGAVFLLAFALTMLIVFVVVNVIVSRRDKNQEDE